MSKFPYILFFSFDKYNNSINFLKTYNNELNCTLYFINENQDKLIKCIYNNHYNLLITFGNTIEEYESIINKHLDKKKKEIFYYHLYNINSINEFNELVNNLYIQTISLSRELLRPIFSIFTTTFNSYEKIIRCYNSIVKQTLKNWEWIIVDDSPNDNHFNYLRDLFKNDINNEFYNQIRIFRKSHNSGNIGNVKNEAVSLCRGTYILELDHDDEIMPYLLEESYETFIKNTNIDFIYWDFTNIYENGDNFNYGDFICKGYGGYYMQYYDILNKWIYVYSTPNINNITLSHLVCCPNHPRIWKKNKLLELGNYCEYLPMCDDYEILLLTALNLKCAKIHKLGYIQYMNNNNNNFSLIMNEEINRIGPQYISPIYFDIFEINKKMKEKNAYDDEYFINNYSKIWQRNNYEYNYCNLIINNNNKKQILIIGLDSLYFYFDKIQNYIEYNKINNNYYDFLLLENKSNLDYLIQKLNNLNLNFIKCYTLIDETIDNLIKYFKFIYLSTNEYEILNIDMNYYKPNYNSNLLNRYEVINSLTLKESKYLEIGVETGHTFFNTHFNSFNKFGIDIDPKIDLTIITNNIYIGYSSNYFKTKKKEQLFYLFDVIFIDGMHQTEYFIEDLNNSLECLTKNGIIFIDDILPLNFKEQLKIPEKYKIENNIIKYIESWTGDIWKSFYYILLNFKQYFYEIKYFHNINYRGIAYLRIKNKFQLYNNEEERKNIIEIINNYDYYNDFKNYLILLKNL